MSHHMYISASNSRYILSDKENRDILRTKTIIREMFEKFCK